MNQSDECDSLTSLHFSPEMCLVPFHHWHLLSYSLCLDIYTKVAKKWWREYHHLLTDSTHSASLNHYQIKWEMLCVIAVNKPIHWHWHCDKSDWTTSKTFTWLFHFTCCLAQRITVLQSDKWWKGVKGCNAFNHFVTFDMLIAYTVYQAKTGK